MLNICSKHATILLYLHLMKETIYPPNRYNQDFTCISMKLPWNYRSVWKHFASQECVGEWQKISIYILFSFLYFIFPFLFLFYLLVHIKNIHHSMSTCYVIHLTYLAKYVKSPYLFWITTTPHLLQILTSSCTTRYPPLDDVGLGTKDLYFDAFACWYKIKRQRTHSIDVTIACAP